MADETKIDMRNEFSIVEPTHPPGYLQSVEAFQEMIMNLAPEWRIRIGAMLTDNRMRGWLSTTGDAAATEMIKTMTYAEVAELTGRSVSAINQRVIRSRQGTT